MFTALFKREQKGYSRSIFWIPYSIRSRNRNLDLSKVLNIVFSTPKYIVQWNPYPTFCTGPERECKKQDKRIKRGLKIGALLHYSKRGKSWRGWVFNVITKLQKLQTINSKKVLAPMLPGYFAVNLHGFFFLKTYVLMLHAPYVLKGGIN